MILVGIEGADAATRNAASQRLGARLRETPHFASVDNGDTAPWQQAGRFVFAHRYALSPAVDAKRFEVEGLRTAIDETLALLGTPAGTLIKPILLRDPTGETVRIVEAMTPAQAPKSEDGVWVSRTAPRAVLVVTTKADGADLDGQQGALNSIRNAFVEQAQRPGANVEAEAGLRLELSGAGSFGVAARESIRSEVERLAIWGGAIMVVLLWLAFASLRALAVAMLPVATGVLAGIAAVQLGFGQVHGMTLGFGTTLIGEAVDYAIYYLIQARAADGAASAGDADSHARRWLRESWPTVRLGLFTSLIGFAALVFAGFPGLAQLGVFSVAGLLAAAATTRYVFPVIAPAGAPGAGLREQLGRLMRAAAATLPRLRLVVVVLAVAATLALVVLPSPWRGQLADLSPIAAADLERDAALRADVGAPDAGTLVAVSARDEAGALAAAEAVGARLDALVKEGVLQGYASPARFLPSPATQRARLAALPDAGTLTARLAEATEGGPLPAARLGAFVDEVQAARKDAVFDRAALEGTPLATAVDALLAARRCRAALARLAEPAGRTRQHRRRGQGPRRDRRRAGRAAGVDQARARRALCPLSGPGRMAGGPRRGGGGGAAGPLPAQRAPPGGGAAAGRRRQRRRVRRAGGERNGASASCISSGCCSRSRSAPTTRCSSTTCVARRRSTRTRSPRCCSPT